ncbi:CS domain-containing protein [Meloidogyne graminicola]|uniref:CS domain-containing protein n=1 Tax=Meloidogyne graminicola TaxID=189291 RepID=A0A8T0A054_9BILA|nr:CS domain-containing protein [Meloidogyne graminicola]
MTSVVKHPSILWAQRAGQIFLTIEDGDLKVNELVCEDDKFKILGEKGGEKYEADLVLFAKLKGAERRKVETSRRLELVIPKETEEWWPRLLKAPGKVAWIKVDFDKWRDEDEVADYEDEGMAAPMDFSKFMPAGGKDGLGGTDFSSFGMPGKGYDDLDLGDDDYDDEMGDLEDADNEIDGNKEKKGEDMKEVKDSDINGKLTNDGKEKVTEGETK